MRNRAEFFLVWLLRVNGVAMVCAVFAVFMPASMMAAIHREWLGLGELPMGPVVEYLARSVSAFYVLFGALHFVAAADVRGRAFLVRFIALATIILGAAFVGIAIFAGLPWWWVVGEGAATVMMGAAILGLYLAAGVGKPERED